METETKDSKSNLGIIGWILFIVGIVLMVYSLSNFIFYGPIFIATFIISIILMTRKQVASGVLLLLITLILPPILWFGLFANRFTDSMNSYDERKETEFYQQKLDIKFEDIKIYDRGNYMYCEGKVRNIGESTYEYVKVKVEWLDKNNIILDTDYTYAVSGEGLGPNEAKSFQIMTQSDKRMKSARYYLIE